MTTQEKLVAVDNDNKNHVEHPCDEPCCTEGALVQKKITGNTMEMRG